MYEKQELQECTFKPILKAYYKAKYKSNSYLQVEDWLLEQAKKRQTDMEKLKHKVEEERFKECSFKPTYQSLTNNFKKSIPLHEWVGDV